MTNIASNLNVNTPVSTPSQGTIDSASTGAAIDTSSLSNAAQKAALAVMAALASADNQNSASNSNGSGFNPLAPELTQPSKSTSHSDSTYILASIAEALNRSSEATIQANAAAFTAIQASLQQQAVAQAQQAQNSLTLASEASDVANSYKSPGGSGQATTLTIFPSNDPSYADSQTLAQLQTNLSQAYVSYEAAQQDPDLQSIDPALLQQAQAKLTNAQTIYQSALNAVYEFASQETQKANNYLTQASTTSAIPLAGLYERMTTGLGKIIELIAMISKLMASSAKEKLNRDQALFEKMQEASKKSLELAAQDYEKKIQQAKQAQDTMGCVGKITGAVLTVVGAVVAVATAPTGIGLAVGIGIAAIGIGMLLADTILEATGHKSLTDMIMQPFMDNIIQPMINALTKAFTEILEKLGVDAETAQKIGTGLALATTAIALIALIVVVALVGKSAAAKLAEKFGEKFAQIAAKNFIQQIVKQLAQQAVKSTAKEGTRGALKQGIITSLKVAGAAGQIAQSSVVMAGGIISSLKIEEAMRALADAKFSEAILKLLEDLMKKAIEEYGDAKKAIENLTETMSKTMQGNINTTSFILGNIGSKSA